jgi:nitric oxide reductase subunit B
LPSPSGTSWARINGELMGMVIFSVLPVGLLQTPAAVSEGYWYARSSAFMQTPVMNTLRWLRVVGDTVFAVGIVALSLFVLGPATGRSYKRTGSVPGGGAAAPPGVG